MKNISLEVGSPKWVAAWGKLLGNGIAIRSQVRINQISTAFVGEILFMERNSLDSKIYSVGFWRKTGRANDDPLSCNPITEFNEFEPPLDTFMAERGQRWLTDRGARIGDRFLQPVTHVGVVSQLATTTRIIPPTNELLMSRYGMIYERIVTLREQALSGATNNASSLWVLQRRLMSFLFEQEMLSANAELGEAII